MATKTEQSYKVKISPDWYETSYDDTQSRLSQTLINLSENYESLREEIALLQSSIAQGTRVTRQEAEETRTHLTRGLSKVHNNLKGIILMGNLSIIDCIKFNPIKNIKIISLFGIFITLFSILSSILVKVHILNPFFAILALITSIGFFIMAKVEEKDGKRQ